MSLPLTSAICAGSKVISASRFHAITRASFGVPAWAGLASSSAAQAAPARVKFAISGPLFQRASSSRHVVTVATGNSTNKRNGNSLRLQGGWQPLSWPGVADAVALQSEAVGERALVSHGLMPGPGMPCLATAVTSSAIIGLAHGDRRPDREPGLILSMCYPQACAGIVYRQAHETATAHRRLGYDAWNAVVGARCNKLHAQVRSGGRPAESRPNRRTVL